MSDEVSVVAYMISRAQDQKRLDMFERTVREAVETAGVGFTLVLCPMTEEAYKLSVSLKHSLDAHIMIRVFTLAEKVVNVGQHVVTNWMIKFADEEQYDYLLRLDDDVKFLTKRWLKKMVDAAEQLGPGFIISPLVVGLQNPPETTPEIEQNGVKFRVVLGAIGGICRLHNLDTLVNPINPYVSDTRLPLGFGDATGIMNWCAETLRDHQMQVWCVYLESVRVKHAKGTAKQVKENPEYHEAHDLFQHLPYIPAWEG